MACAGLYIEHHLHSPLPLHMKAGAQLFLLLTALVGIWFLYGKYKAAYMGQLDEEIARRARDRDTAESMYKKNCFSHAHVIEMRLGNNCTDWAQKYVDVTRRKIEAAARMHVDQEWGNFNLAIVTNIFWGLCILIGAGTFVAAITTYLQLQDARRSQFSLPGSRGRVVKVD